MDYSEDSDNDLYRRFAAGDRKGYTLLVERHTDKFYGLAWRMSGHNQDAEDIVQDAFIKIWQRPELFNPDKGVKFTTWFYRVVVNLSLDKMRKKKPKSASDFLESIQDDAQGADDDLADKQKQAAIELAIQSLPERQKVALNLCFYEGVSNAEAAEIMEVGVKALESLLMRAKKNLKDHLLRDDQIKEVVHG